MYNYDVNRSSANNYYDIGKEQRIQQVHQRTVVNKITSAISELHILREIYLDLANHILF